MSQLSFSLPFGYGKFDQSPQLNLLTPEQYLSGTSPLSSGKEPTLCILYALVFYIHFYWVAVLKVWCRVPEILSGAYEIKKIIFFMLLKQHLPFLLLFSQSWAVKFYRYYMMCDVTANGMHTCVFLSF